MGITGVVRQVAARKMTVKMTKIPARGPIRRTPSPPRRISGSGSRMASGGGGTPTPKTTAPSPVAPTKTIAPKQLTRVTPTRTELIRKTGVGRIREPRIERVRELRGIKPPTHPSIPRRVIRSIPISRRMLPQLTMKRAQGFCMSCGKRVMMVNGVCPICRKITYKGKW